MENSPAEKSLPKEFCLKLNFIFTSFQEKKFDKICYILYKNLYILESSVRNSEVMAIIKFIPKGKWLWPLVSLKALWEYPQITETAIH